LNDRPIGNTTSFEPGNGLEDLIIASCPMPVRDYMDLCLTHPRWGYYRRHKAIGAEGDFVTAPEISQVFGELIGIWCATIWHQIGSPEAWRIVELGPGRATLLLDLLRAIKVAPAARAGLSVDFVEINPRLIDVQRQRLVTCGVPVTWASSLEPKPLPTVVIANEFLDALPVRQLVRGPVHWHERMVAADASGTLDYARGPVVDGAAAPAGAPEHAIFETRDGCPRLIEALAAQARVAPLAALFIDYGHEGPVLGETLQAVAGHRYAGIFERPGAADLSAHVDFAELAAAARAAGLTASPVITQAEFLSALGLAARLDALLARADAATANRLETGVARLVSPDGMGTRFKVLMLGSSGQRPAAAQA
jgi:NADH dehydrogenase [ubiquinone] 1 alpha subcomplex assembly factor 7